MLPLRHVGAASCEPSLYLLHLNYYLRLPARKDQIATVTVEAVPDDDDDDDADDDCDDDDGHEDEDDDNGNEQAGKRLFLMVL